jgi:hypothetical protein
MLESSRVKRVGLIRSSGLLTEALIMRDKATIEREVLETVRRLSQPTNPTEVVKRVSKSPEEDKTAREVIRSLVDRGNLTVTLDWKIRLEDKGR